MLVPGQTVPEFSGVPLAEKKGSKLTLCNVASARSVSKTEKSLKQF